MCHKLTYAYKGAREVHKLPLKWFATLAENWILHEDQEINACRPIHSMVICVNKGTFLTLLFHFIAARHQPQGLSCTLIVGNHPVTILVITRFGMGPLRFIYCLFRFQTIATEIYCLLIPNINKIIIFQIHLLFISHCDFKILRIFYNISGFLSEKL